MSSIWKIGQGVAIAVVAVAAVPVGIEAFSAHRARHADAARAADLLLAARGALEAADVDLAADAAAAALAADPQLDAARALLLDARVEQLLREPVSVAPGAAVRLDADLRVALAGPRKANPRYQLAHGRILQLRDKPEAARALFAEVVAANPSLARAQLLLGDALLKAGDLNAALPVLQKAVELDAAAPEGHLALGQALLRQEKWDEAAVSLSRAVDASPKNAQALLALGTARLRQKQYDSAQAALEKALAADPNIVGVHPLLGEAYAGLGKAEAAIGAFRVAWERHQDVGAYRNLGRILLQIGRPTDALTVFKTLQALDDTDPEPLVAIALCAQALGDLDSAEAALARAASLLPKVTPPEKAAQWQKIVAERKTALADARSRGGKAPGKGAKDAGDANGARPAPRH